MVLKLGTLKGPGAMFIAEFTHWRNFMLGVMFRFGQTRSDVQDYRDGEPHGPRRFEYGPLVMNLRVELGFFRIYLEAWLREKETF
jgi:hypothetical protein